MTVNKRRLGGRYEDMAASYLLEKGYEIIERNYRNPRGELDIIAKQGGVIVYVEVRYRSSDAYGDPFATVDKRKQRQICKVALWHYAGYCAEKELPCRFDVIGISGDGVVRHIENAFDFCG